jgi:hypothetical protein
MCQLVFIAKTQRRKGISGEPAPGWQMVHAQSAVELAARIGY